MNNSGKEIYPVMLTPFNDDLSIDFYALQQLTDFYIAAGSTGLFANCLSSEMFELSDEERIKITETVVRQVAGRQEVVATGTFYYDQKKNVDFVKRIYQSGVNAVVLNTNQLARESESDTVWMKNIEYILKNTDNIPLGLYECPVPYKRLLSPELLKWLAQTGRFGFFKETSCNLNQINPKLEAIKGSSIKLLNANIPTAMKSLQNGASGVATTATNFYPELVKYLVSNFNLKNEKTEQVNSWLTVADSLIDINYPLSAKYFLKLRGIEIKTNTRLKNLQFSFQDYVKFDKLLRVFTRLANDLEIDIFSTKNSSLKM